VNEAVFFHDGSMFVTAGNDGTVRVWDPRSGAEVARIAAKDGPLHGIALAPDNRLAVTTDLRVWDLSDPTDRMFAEELKLRRCAVSPDGQCVVTANHDGTLKLWDLTTWKLLGSVSAHSRSVTSVCFLPDGRRVVSVGWDYAVTMWDTSSGAVARRQTSQTFPGSSDPTIAASPDGRTVAFRNGDHEIVILDVETWQDVRTLSCDQQMASVTFSSDGRRLLTGHTGDAGNYKSILWDVATGEPIRKFYGHGHWVQCVALSADGKTAITGSWDQRVIVFDAETGAIRHRLQGHTGHVTAVAVSKDGHTCLSASRDGTLRLWDLRTGKLVRTFSQGVEIHDLALLAADAMSAIALDKTYLRVWRFDSARELGLR
jgi:WD40 repeat protein